MLLVPFWLAARQHCVTSTEAQVFSLASQAGCSVPGAGPAPSQDPQEPKSTSKPQITTGWGRACIGVASRSPQTRSWASAVCFGSKSSSSIKADVQTLKQICTLLLPGCPDRCSLFPHQSCAQYLSAGHVAQRAAYLSYIWLFSCFHCWFLWQYKCSETDTSHGFVWPFPSAGVWEDKTHIWLRFHAQLCQRALLLFRVYRPARAA